MNNSPVKNFVAGYLRRAMPWVEESMAFLVIVTGDGTFRLPLLHRSAGDVLLSEIQAAGISLWSWQVVNRRPSLALIFAAEKEFNP